MCRIASALILVVALPLPGVFGQSTGESVDIDKLIEQLSDQDFHKRQAAAKALQNAGIRALDKLKKAENHPDPEVRRWIRQNLPELEKRAILQPTRVTLQCKNKPFAEVIKSIEKQTGFSIGAYPDEEARRLVYDFDLKDVPFWQAIDAVCSKTGLMLQNGYGYGDGRIRLSARRGVAPFVHYHGPFRISAETFRLSKTLRLNLLPVDPKGLQSNLSQQLSLDIIVSSEPRLPLLGSFSVRLEKAVDERDNSLLPPRQQSTPLHDELIAYNMGGSDNYSLPCNVQLVPPPDNATKLKYIKGIVPVTLLTKNTPIVLAEPLPKADGKRATVGDFSFDIKNISKGANGLIQVDLAIQRNSNSNRDLLFHLYRRIELHDKDGKKYGIRGSSITHNGNLLRCRLDFGPRGNAGKPRRLVFQDWTTMPYEIPFVFRDLPLP
ncbi:MAG: hypothetical protein KatS3mg105_4730 [Gemmatales bacterium]|nr:MAG: hypothetical protein KatS3mg105_4730 [Gemmatales bacterium]